MSMRCHLVQVQGFPVEPGMDFCWQVVLEEVDGHIPAGE